MDGFQVVPTPVNASVEQGRATFSCQHSLADSIQWSLNGTARNRLNLPNISVYDDPSDGDGTRHILSIETLPQYNQTTIECVASFNESPSKDTPPVTLLIQGMYMLILMHTLHRLPVVIYRHSWQSKQCYFCKELYLQYPNYSMGASTLSGPH